MAKRYSGTLELSISLGDDDAYDVRVYDYTTGTRFLSLTGLRLAPATRSRFAVDSALAYDEVARAALGWMSDFDDRVHYLAASGSDGYVVRRRLRTGG
jgi:hypothetical protein